MKKNAIMYGDDVRQALLAGVTKVTRAVVVTMGGKGMSVIAEREYAAPIVTNDGVTIARGIELLDPQENMACLLVKEAAEKTNTDTGDGTTTVCLLTQAILQEAVRNIAAGANPREVKDGIDKAVDFVCKELVKQAKPVRTKAERIQVATISACNKQWGEEIVEAIDKVGKDGIVTVDEGSKTETTIETIKGFQFENGFISPYFINKMENYECVLNDPYIIYVDRDLASFTEMTPILEEIKAKNRPYVLIAHSVDGELLANLVLNKMKGRLPGVAVKAPAVGNRRAETLADMAVLTSGTILSREVGIEMKKVRLKDLGECKKVIVNKDYTTIMGGKAKKADVTGRIKVLKEQIKAAQSDWDKDKLKDRLAKLTGGIAQILVGASTETEMKSKKYKYEDALYATKAAIQEGIVAGGGVAYLNCLTALKRLKVSPGEQVGVEIIAKILCKPIEQIVSNAGKNGEVVRLTAMEKGKNIGYDVIGLKYVDMIKAGIIDPVKVSRLALMNAASAAGNMIVCGAEITDIPEEDRVSTMKDPKSPHANNKNY